MTTIQHFSDTIGYDSNNKPGITTQRLTIWYEQLAQSLGINYDNLDFKGSTFGESFETGASALKYLTTLSEEQKVNSQVILVNNASRAKHENSREAKGSDCLVAEIVIDGNKHYIVGVDNEIFAFINQFQKREIGFLDGVKLKKIKGIDFNIDETHINIDDLSTGTQFRSKEHFPLAQLLLIRYLQKNGNLDLDGDIEGLKLEEFNKEVFLKINEEIRNDVAFLIRRTPYVANLGKVAKTKFYRVNYEGTGLSTLDILRDYVRYVDPEQNKINPKTYVEGYEGIERILNIGELHLLYDKLGIVYNPSIHDSYEARLCSKDIIETYNKLRETLQSNQIALVHRDLFGNGFFTTKCENNGSGIDLGIGKLCEINGFKIGDKVKISGGGLNFEVILTKTISDHTGENCLWNSSGRGPRGETLLNLNKSIDSSGKILYEIQDLPIGTVLTLERN